MNIIVHESVGMPVHQKRGTPVYLVIVDDPIAKTKVQKFIATRLDENQHGAKFVGIETSKTIPDICKDFQDIVNSADKNGFKELLVPWSHVVRVQHLTFKPVKV